MKNINKLFVLALLLQSVTTVCGCDKEESNTSSIEEVSSSMDLDSINVEQIVDFPDYQIEVDQKEYLDCYIAGIKSFSFHIKDSSIIKIVNNYLIGLKEGSTYFLLEYNNKYQKINVTVSPKGTYSAAWNFDSLKETAKNKNFIVIGDSVSAEATYSNAGKTYTQLIATSYEANFKKNYAIGGTTATYMYEGSNIEKEYKNSTTAIDGVRVTKTAYDRGELSNVDFAFIAYGHNDQYYQPPLDGDTSIEYDVNSFDSAHSFKGSYRYIVKTLRKANPNIKIIILGCTYSEYDKTTRSKQWTYSLTYADYRKAIYEVAHELDCKYVDPWNYFKNLFDGNSDTKYIYNDVVHIGVLGHKKLAAYIKKH